MTKMIITRTVWTFRDTEMMRLITARSTAVVKMEVTENVNTLLKTIRKSGSVTDESWLQILAPIHTSDDFNLQPLSLNKDN